MFAYDAIRARIPAGAIEAPVPASEHRRIGGVARRIVAAIRARHDAYVRREIAERHERWAHHHEVGGDFSVLP